MVGARWCGCTGGYTYLEGDDTLTCPVFQCLNYCRRTGREYIGAASLPAPLRLPSVPWNLCSEIILMKSFSKNNLVLLAVTTKFGCVFVRLCCHTSMVVSI